MNAAVPSSALDLILASAQTADRPELTFFAVNRSVMAVAYDRASWWDVRGVPEPLAVSGLETIDGASRFVAIWRSSVADASGGGTGRGDAVRLPPVSIAGAESAALADAFFGDVVGGVSHNFSQDASNNISSNVPSNVPGKVPGDVSNNAVNNTSNTFSNNVSGTVSGQAVTERGLSRAVWLPLPDTGQGICFERWGGADFTDGEIDALRALCAGYALTWRAFGGRGFRRSPRRRLAGWLIFFVLLAAALYGIRVPLRVMAGCEVTARSPVLIAAPMDGVIEEVTVRPGQEVGKGDVLALYNPRLMEEELRLARRRVAVVEAELASARARGFSEQRYRSEVSLLEARLEQEQARLEGAETRMAMLRVVAPEAGVVQMDDARAWRGKPVATGQAVMWLVNARDSRVSLWLPQDDRIEFDPARPVYVYLQALGGEPLRARLTHVSTFAQLSPEGVYAFPAEADWLDEGEPPPLGLRGTASLTGGEARLGYWLFRRPLAAIRLWLGY